MNRTSLIILVFSTAIISGPASADAGPLRSLWKAGQKTIGKLFGEAAEASGKAVTRKVTRHADDVARVIVRNGDEATGLIVKSFSDDLADVAKTVSPENGRRLLAMADELNASGRGAEILQLLKPGGKADQVVDFLYRHKGALAGGAVLTTLITSPDTVLGAVSDTTVGLAEVAGENIAKPMIAEAGDALAPVVPTVATHLMWIVGLVLLISVAMMCRKHHRQCIEALRNRSADVSDVVEVNAGSHQSLLSRLKHWYRQ